MMAALKEFVSHNTQFNRVHVNIYQMNYQIVSEPLIKYLMLSQCEDKIFQDDQIEYDICIYISWLILNNYQFATFTRTVNVL